MSSEYTCYYVEDALEKKEITKKVWDSLKNKFKDIIEYKNTSKNILEEFYIKTPLRCYSTRNTFYKPIKLYPNKTSLRDTLVNKGIL